MQATALDRVGLDADAELSGEELLAEPIAGSQE